MPSQQEIRESITQTIIAALESGDLPPWRKPWKNDPNAGFPTNVVSKKMYRGINPLLLQISSMRHGFQSKWFATFKQWSEMGGQVMRRPDGVEPGEWGTKIVFFKPVKKRKSDENEKEETYLLLRTYTVFSLDQVMGDHLDHLRVGHAEEPVRQIDGYLEAKRVIEATGADIREGGNAAFYRPHFDYIQVPSQSQCDLRDWYETVLHELCHWAEPRLNWKGPYALGELIAEIGSCFLAAEVGIPVSQHMTNHAAYLKTWLSAMADDPRYIFQASTQATKAADYVLSFSRTTQPDEALVQ